MPFSATTPDGVPISVRGGTRMRSHEAVQRWPQYFLADGATDGEKAAAYRKLAGDAVIADPAPAATVLEPMSGDDVVESLEDSALASRRRASRNRGLRDRLRQEDGTVAVLAELVNIADLQQLARQREG
jgi:hypothetical protein